MHAANPHAVSPQGDSPHAADSYAADVYAGEPQAADPGSASRASLIAADAVVTGTVEHSVVGSGALVAGTAIRSVVLPGATVGPDETLVDAVRAGTDVTLRAPTRTIELAGVESPAGRVDTAKTSNPGADPPATIRGSPHESRPPQKERP